MRDVDVQTDWNAFWDKREVGPDFKGLKHGIWDSKNVSFQGPINGVLLSLF